MISKRLILLLGILNAGVFAQNASRIQADFQPKILEIDMKYTEMISVNLSNIQKCRINDELFIKSDNEVVSQVDFEIYRLTGPDIISYKLLNFNVTGKFLGKTKIRVTTSSEECLEPEETFDVVVTKTPHVIDQIFIVVIAIFASVVYVNFGCAIDWTVVKNLLIKPIGPLIGFFSQFVLMPLIAYFSGLLLFPNNVELRLGMFLVGISPGGGSSNMWTYLLGGNIHLSITMTTISTFAAFGMMPFWLFTLGKKIFDSGNLRVPYLRVIIIAISLIFPLSIGILIKKYLPRLAKILIGTLKWLTPILVMSIIGIGLFTNMHIFLLFSWRIIVAGLCVPWLGYLFGYLTAFIMRQPKEDCLAIAIETGVQHIGTSIFLISFSLPKPESDLTLVIPAAVGCFAPIPLVVMALCKILKKRYLKRKENSRASPDDIKMENANVTEEMLPNK